jgi:hypothetical protein
MRTQHALGARDGIELAKLLDGAAPWPGALREHVSPLAKMIAERSAAERHAATVQRPGAHRTDRRPRVTVERVKREAAEAGCWWREGADRMAIRLAHGLERDALRRNRRKR